jgi:hypothetical protein
MISTELITKIYKNDNRYKENKQDTKRPMGSY